MCQNYVKYLSEIYWIVIFYVLYAYYSWNDIECYIALRYNQNSLLFAPVDFVVIQSLQLYTLLEELSSDHMMSCSVELHTLFIQRVSHEFQKSFPLLTSCSRDIEMFLTPMFLNVSPAMMVCNLVVKH